jgi:DNA-binding XRE family transcriptional regulator
VEEKKAGHPMAQGSDDRRGSDLPRGDFKGGGLRLSGLKLWRERRGLSQGQLAKLVGVPPHYVQRIEQGRRGCNLWVAEKLAEELEVDLEELRAASAPEEGEKGTEGGVRARQGGPPVAKPRRSSLHRAYLKVLLEREVGSAYSALEEREFESRCMKLSVEELLEIVSSRERERELLKEVLADTAPLHPEVRTFLEELVREHPGEDLRILAARRNQETQKRSERGLPAPCVNSSCRECDSWAPTARGDGTH